MCKNALRAPATSLCTMDRRAQRSSIRTTRAGKSVLPVGWDVRAETPPSCRDSDGRGEGSLNKPARSACCKAAAESTPSFLIAANTRSTTCLRVRAPTSHLLF